MHAMCTNLDDVESSPKAGDPRLPLHTTCAATTMPMPMLFLLPLVRWCAMFVVAGAFSSSKEGRTLIIPFVHRA